MTRLHLTALALALAGCVQSTTGDVVPSSAAAIELAKKLCDDAGTDAGWSWHARFRQGMWHVWLDGSYQRREEEAVRSVEIRASDGSSSGCPVVT